MGAERTNAPNARMRLVRAAVDLYYDHGYDATTVAQIAQAAGLTKATFFRHFRDKREVLFAGQEEFSALLAAGIADAPPDVSVLDAVTAGLVSVTATFTPESHEFGPRLTAAVQASPELRERDALKAVGLAAAITGALVARGAPETAARLAAEMGVIAFKHGFTRWSDDDRDDAEQLTRHTLAALDELRSAAVSLD